MSEPPRQAPSETDPRRIHPVAALGFSRAGAAYETARPGYPRAAAELLARELDLRPGRRLLDLAAGTGKLTRALVGFGPTIVAVEPVAEMRAQLLRAVPGVTALAGTAEDIPVPDDGVDAVVVGMAFHWFDAPAAAAEIHRVLVPGGALGVAWYRWDRSVAWVDEVQGLVRGHGSEVPQSQSSGWRRQITATRLFGPLSEQTFPHLVDSDLDTLLLRISTSSFIAALPDERRARVLAEARRILDDHGLGSGAPFQVPYRAHVVWARRQESKRPVSC